MVHSINVGPSQEVPKLRCAPCPMEAFPAARHSHSTRPEITHQRGYGAASGGGSSTDPSRYSSALSPVASYRAIVVDQVALFLIAPIIAVRIAPPAPPAIAWEIIPPMLKLPD